VIDNFVVLRHIFARILVFSNRVLQALVKLIAFKILVLLISLLLDGIVTVVNYLVMVRVLLRMYWEYDFFFLNTC